MHARINLLGTPSIEVDGAVVAPPRGSKSWGLLAYLVLTTAPVPRSRLTDLLFDEADDPDGALRWSLSQLRRALNGVASVEGNPLRLEIGESTTIDVHVVTEGSWTDAHSLRNFGAQLLEGLPLHVGPAFEVWLSSERRRFIRITQAMLHEAAHSHLVQGDPESAALVAARAVGADALNESSHELLIRALVATGDHAEARRQAARCREIFRRELGIDPSRAINDALRHTPVSATSTSRGAILAAIEAGSASYRAGAYDRAVELLRSAVDGARLARQPNLLASALAGLGTAMVHGVRGTEGEAVTLLHEAVLSAVESGSDDIAAQASYELGHIETLRANYPRMEYWLGQAAERAHGSPGLRAWIALFTAFGRSDQADYVRATRGFADAERLARSVSDVRAIAFANAGLGRLRLLRGESGPARRTLDVACAAAREAGWTSFLPFPEALRAELDLIEGRVDSAAEALDHSYELACQVGDPCWQGYSLRGRGLVAAATGDDALELLVKGWRACQGVRNTYDWIQGSCLDSLCGFAVGHGLREANGWVDELEDFASRRGMRELVARAALHRVGLHQDGAGPAAALLLETIDNPALQALAATAGVRASGG